MNLDLAQRVYKQITEFPETLDMKTWAAERKSYLPTFEQGELTELTLSSCGTVACIAGHALFLSGYSFRTEVRVQQIEGGGESLFKHPVFIRPDGSEISDQEIPVEARMLLDLSDEEYYDRSSRGLMSYPHQEFGGLFYDLRNGVTRLRDLIRKAEAE